MLDTTFVGLLAAFLFTSICILSAAIFLHEPRLPPAASKPDNSRSGRASTPPQNTTETPLRQDKGLSSSFTSSSSAKTSESKEHRSLKARRVTDLHVSRTGVTAEEGPTATEVGCGNAGSDHEDALSPSSSKSGLTGCDPSEPESTSCPLTSHQTGGGATQGNAGLEEVDADGLSLKYIPGVVRMSQLEKMMTTEELEAEQRVQDEQLAAIFQLLKENQETFGEVKEGDVEEQLKLYSI